MRQRIHRDNLMFHWFTRNHEIVAGFKQVRYGRCDLCGKTIAEGDSLCDVCFAKKKEVSKK